MDSTPRAFAIVVLSLVGHVGPGLATAVDSLKAEAAVRKGYVEEVLGVEGVGRVVLRSAGDGGGASKTKQKASGLQSKVSGRIVG